jgi:tetratricopeptide (TPR) repeat protein
MHCLHCSTENHEAARFCRRCGRLLGDFCPRCGNTLVADSDFCNQCGLALPSRTAGATPELASGGMADRDRPSSGLVSTALDRQLQTLQAADLIRQAALVPELEYIFRHSLMQEATYRTILRSQRQEFHRHIGVVMERLFAGELDKQAATLAYHFHEAGDDERALKYFALAGDRAFRLCANAEAVNHYAGAFAVARRSGAPSEQLVHLGTRLGRALELTNDYAQALATYAEMEQWAAERADPRLRLAALLAQATAYGTQSAVHDPARATARSQEALALARELTDPAAEAKALWNLMLVGFWSGGNQQRALAYGRDSLAIARQHGLHEQMGYTLNNLAGAYWGLGRFTEAQAVTAEARRVWQELNNLSMLGDAYNMSSWTNVFRGQLADGVAEARAGRQISQAIGNDWNQAGAWQVEGLARFHQGLFHEALAALQAAVEFCRKAQISAADTLGCMAETYAALGAGDRAREAIRQSLAQLETLAAAFHPLTLGSLARAYLTLGLPAEAEAVLQMCTPAGELTWAHSPLMLAQAELATAQGRPPDAIRILDELVPYVRKSGLDLYLYDALYVRGTALLALRQWEQAAQALGEARSMAEAMCARRLLRQILAALAEVEHAQANPGEAERLRGLAREHVDFVALHAGSDELRGTFLARPETQDVLMRSYQVI